MHTHNSTTSLYKVFENPLCTRLCEFKTLKGKPKNRKRKQSYSYPCSTGILDDIHEVVFCAAFKHSGDQSRQPPSPGTKSGVLPMEADQPLGCDSATSTTKHHFPSL